jgi:hypothetical protein
MLGTRDDSNLDSGVRTKNIPKNPGSLGVRLDDQQAAG